VARKKLDDVIHGDRAKVRAAQKGDDWGRTDHDRKNDEVMDFGEWAGGDKWGSSKDDWGSGSSSSKKKGETHWSDTGARCFHSHPPLKLPGADKVIYGGSCNYPAVTDADVYIGFDRGMPATEKAWPWTPGFEVPFFIPDMGVPKDPLAFASLVTWTREMLDAGKKVHCGCIGGHGRTGTFLAALVSCYGEADAISYVRKNYCKRAVESSTQIDFLAQHYGVVKVAATKSFASASDWKPSSTLKNKGGAVVSGKKGVQSFSPLPNNGSIFG